MKTFDSTEVIRSPEQFKKWFPHQTLGLMATLVLIIGLAAGVYLVQKRQSVAQRASTTLVDLSFSPSKTTLAPGETVDLNVLIDTKSYSVTAASVAISFSPQIFKVTKIVSNNRTYFFSKNFDSASMQMLNIAINDRLASGSASISLSVPCPNTISTPSPSTTPCLVASGSGILAKFSLQVLTSALAGPTTVSFDTLSDKTAITALDQSASVLGDATPVTLTISSLSPSSTPVTNNPPEVRTGSLPNGSVGIMYQTTIQASDPDMTDTLSLNASGLPPGITLETSTCQPVTQTNKIILKCQMRGTPASIGTSQVTFTVTDSQGTSGQKTLTLQVN